MPGLVAARDWSETPLGPRAGWSPSLQMAVDIVLASGFPMALRWGPEFILIYNDAYRPILGDKHPWALGRPAGEAWPEVWPQIEPDHQRLLNGDSEALFAQDILLRIQRYADTWEDARFTLSYSPTPDPTSPTGVGGVFVTAIEITQQVEAERANAVARERQQHLLSQMPGFVGVLSGPDHIFEYVNDAYITIAGPREFIGRTIRQVFPELSGQGIYELLDEVFSAGRRHIARAMPIRLAGETEDRFVDFVYEPIRDGEGAVTGVFVGGYDATETHRGAAALRASEERLRLVIEGARDHAIITTDPDGVITSWSAGAEAIFGWTTAEACGSALSIIFTPEDRAAGADRRELITAASEGISNDRRWHERKDGGRVFMNGSLHCLPPDAQGRPRGFLKIARDETDRRLAEIRRDARMELVEQVRDLADPAEIEYVSARVLGQALGVSRVGYGTIDNAAADILRVDRDWTAQGVDTLSGDTTLRDYGSFIDSLQRGEVVVINDVREDPRTAAASPALEARSARSFVNIPVVEHGALVAVLYVNHAEVRRWTGADLNLIREVADRIRLATERVRGQHELRTINAELEARVEARTRDLMAAEAALRQAQKMEAVGQLTGGIAHDFNNLLAGISGSLELLERRMADGRLDTAQRYIDTARTSAQRAAALTQRLLAFSRRQTLDPRATDVNRLVAGMDDLIRRTVGPSIAVEVVGAGGLWLTRVDRAQLESALLNLVINARDAMPDGGRLTIETANKWLDAPAARERHVSPGQYVSLCVTDTGTGMTPEVISRAFDPFYTTKPLGQGTGLGLSMIHGFVRQSGGEARIYSEEGEGTTMCLYFPRYVGGLETDEVAAAPAHDHGLGETVLIVDDEPSVRMLVTDVLEEAGYRVLVADDGPSGLKQLQSDSWIDLLITDVGLPGGLNGRQLADAARTSRPDLKVLFITGYAENAVIGNGHLDAGMQVVTKPFVMTELAAKVREMIDGVSGLI